MIWDISGGTLYKEYPQFCPGFFEFQYSSMRFEPLAKTWFEAKILFRSRKVLMKIVSTLIKLRGFPEMIAAGHIILAVQVDLAGGQIAFAKQLIPSQFVAV